MYRNVDCATWDDAWFAELDPRAKLFFLYLVTNRRSTSCGAYEITVRQMAFETGLAADEIERWLHEWAPRVMWWPAHQIVWLRNFVRYQVYNEKMRINARGLVARLPAVVRDEIADAYPDLLPPAETVSIPHREGMDKKAASASASAAKQQQSKAAAASAADRAPPPPSMYEMTINGAMPQLMALFAGVDKQLTATWMRQTLVTVAREVGPLPRDRLGRGLDLAADQMRRSLAAGAVQSPRAFCRKLIIDYLTEQRDGYHDRAANAPPDSADAPGTDAEGAGGDCRGP